MAIDPLIEKVLKKYELPNKALWEHRRTNKKTGYVTKTLIMYHKYLEQVAVKAHIEFQTPFVCSSDADNVAICVTGQFAGEGHLVWSIGEASPENTKNAYPWAMAEKRAKDRVILKLLGIHGLVYSEEEADDFKEEWNGPLGKTDLKGKLRVLGNDMAACEDMDQLTPLIDSYKAELDQCASDLPDWYEKYESNLQQQKDRIDGV